MPIIPQSRFFGYRFSGAKKARRFPAACLVIRCQKLAPAVGCFVTFTGVVGSGVM